MSAPRTLFEKIWTRHVVAEGPGGHVLLLVDRHLLARTGWTDVRTVRS